VIRTRRDVRTLWYDGRVSWLRNSALLALTIAAAPLPASERFEIRFGEHLGLSDLRLVGTRASCQVQFAWPVEWSPQDGAELRLRLQQAPTLDPERSFLGVSLNHGLLRSIRLGPGTPDVTELVVPLAAEMIHEQNQLVVFAEQFSAKGTSDPSWSVVRSDSSITIPFERKHRERSLADLPQPILSKSSYEPRRLTVLLPTHPSRETLEATARLLASLAARVAPAPVSLSFAQALQDVSTPAVAVGTPLEQPSIRELGDLGKDAAPAAPTTGIVALVGEAGPKAQPLLVLTAKEPVGVSKAVLGLFALPRPKGTRLLLVPVAPPLRAPRPREWLTYIPPANGFTVDDSGDPEAELAVTADLPGRVRLKAPPDTRFLPYGQRVTLSFDVLPGLASDAKADLEVFWNDFLLRQVPMEGHAHGRSFTLSASIPPAALRLENVLTVAWNGRSGASGPFVMLRGASTLFLPREYVAELPDLSLLGSAFYPFSMRADLSSLVIGVPGGTDSMPALCELAMTLGRLVPAEQFRFEVASGSEALATRGRDVVLLQAGEEAGALPLPDTGRLPRGATLDRLPLLQEMASPRGDGRYVLRLRARTPALLRAAARNLGEASFLRRLTGDTAYLAAEGPVSFRIGPRRAIVEISYFTRLGAWLREHWLALPLILASISGLLFLGLRLALGSYRSRRLMRQPVVASPSPLP
jgi:Bacterial cellulose synthase subunit